MVLNHKEYFDSSLQKRSLKNQRTEWQQLNQRFERPMELHSASTHESRFLHAPIIYDLQINIKNLVN